MQRALAFLQRYDVLIVFAILFLVNAIWQPGTFLQPENLRNIVNQNAAVGIAALGMTLVIITGGIDLSVGSIMALSGVLAILALNKAMDSKQSEAVASVIAIAVCMGSGALLGVVNGAVVAYGKVAPFIATLVGLVAFRSLSMAFAEGGEVRSSSGTVFPSLGEGGIPIPFLHVSGGQPLLLTWGMVAFFLLAIVAGVLLRYTVYGRHVRATGGNELACLYTGVSVKRTQLWTYTLMGLFSGIAGATLVTRMNSVASSSTGQFYELDAIAAVVIGGTSLRGGSGRIWGTVIGVLMLGIITNMLVMVNVSVYWQGVVKGVIILIAALVQRGRTM